MARDELLDEIRQPLLDRIDRRLAAVLAVSIGTHVAIAIVAYAADPPAVRPWLEADAEYVFTEEMVDQLDVEPPVMVPTEPGPGAVAPAPRPAPSAPPAATPTPSRSHAHAPVPPRKIDAAALVGAALGDSPSFRDEGRRLDPADLEAQLAAAQRRGDGVHLGDGTEADAPSIADGTDPAVDRIDQVARNTKLPEVAPPRTTFDPPPTGIDYDPSDDIRNNKITALQRCFQRQLLLEPGLHGRVELAFTIGKTGAVTAAHASGLGAVSTCVERVAKGWSFPVALPTSAAFRLAMIFVGH